jgi:hypothetical protein
MRFDNVSCGDLAAAWWGFGDGESRNRLLISHTYGSGAVCRVVLTCRPLGNADTDNAPLSVPSVVTDFLGYLSQFVTRQPGRAPTDVGRLRRGIMLPSIAYRTGFTAGVRAIDAGGSATIRRGHHRP